jgi:FixJ family two-component response regulator
MPDGTVYVIDDDADVRTSMRRLFATAGLSVETFRSAREFLAAPELQGPCCVLTDILMPEMDGLDLQDLLAARDARMPVIIITAHADVPRTLRAMKRGAVDLVQKPVDPKVILDIVQRAIDRDRERRRAHSEAESLLRRVRMLTPREREVVDFVIEGHTSPEIAAKLGVSVKTIHAHRSNAMKKVGASSAAQLAQLVMKSRATPP